MKKFTKIPNLRNLVRDVKSRCDYHGWHYPKLDFTGTVKLHGTNAGITFYKNGKILVQSRNLHKQLDEAENFHQEFGKFSQDNIEYIKTLIPNNTSNNITIYGEWVGKGVQKGVAISLLSKRFVIFAIREWEDHNEDSIWHPVPLVWNDEKKIYSINSFPTYNITIDFNNINKTDLDNITNTVAEKCPVADSFNVQGKGEGIVWICQNDDWENYIFKSKSEEFEDTKNNQPKEKKVFSNDILEFCDSVLTDIRLMKGIDYLKEFSDFISRKETGKFLSWVVNDILEEEQEDCSKFNEKDLKKILGNQARKWFFNFLDNDI